MKLIRPMTVTDANLISNNIVEDMPRSTSAVNYNQWSASTSYSVNDVVCQTFTAVKGTSERNGLKKPDGTYFGENDPPAVGGGGTFGPFFGIFTCLIANANYEPGKVTATAASTTIPGSNSYWRLDYYYAVYDAAMAYPKDTIVGYVNGAIGAIYQSLTAGNTGNTPSGSPTNWRQSTPGGFNAWSGATTYALGDRVVVLNGLLGSVFESLQATNLNHTPATSPTWWAYKGDTYKAWAPATPYATGDVAISTTTHHEYEALQASTGKDPMNQDANSTYWLDRGSTNRWRMFDLVNSGQSAFGDTIDVTIQTSGFVDSVAVMNCAATTIQIIAKDSGGVTRYDHTYNLNDPAGVNDWHAYFTEPITSMADFIAIDLPAYINMTVRVILTRTGSQALAGSLLIGLSMDLGAVIYGAKVGINDFSKLEQNDFGDWVIVRRNFAKRNSLTLFVEASKVDTVNSTLAALRAIPLVFFGTSAYLATLVFGYYKSYEVTLSYPSHSFIDLQLAGLT